MATMGAGLVTNGGFHEAKFHWPLSCNQSWKGTVASVPLGDGGGNRERPFAGSGKIGEAAIRYASELFFPELRLCSGKRRSVPKPL